MLANESPSANTSPFTFGAGSITPPQRSQQRQHSQEPIKEYPETNKGRVFRRAGNACEIAAGSCLNSSIVFLFHLLQVHPVGMVLAVGAAHAYFTATAVGEEGRESVNAMTGVAASLSIFCSLHQPIGEWLEAAESKKQTQIEIKQLYPQPQPNFLSTHGWGVGISAFIAVIVILKILVRE